MIDTRRMDESEIRELIDDLVPADTTPAQRIINVKCAVGRLADMNLQDKISFAQYCRGVNYLFERNRALEDAENDAVVTQLAE